MGLITSPCASKEFNLTVGISGHVRKSQLVCGAANPLLGFIVYAAVGRYWICWSLSLEDLSCWVWSETLLLSQPVAVWPAPACAVLQHIRGGLGQIWIRDSGILPIWDVLLLNTYSPKGIFALPLWRQLFNFGGNLIMPMEGNMLKTHAGIQILTLGKILFSKAVYWFVVSLALLQS